MPLKRSVFVPRFDSQISSRQSEKDESVSCSFVSLDQSPAPKRRRPAGLMLTVKLPTDVNRTSGKNSRTSRPQWVLKAKLCQKKPTTGSQRKESHSSADPGSDSVQKDALIFSQGNRPPKSDKEKIKIAVLKNISRMLEENHHIRQRLVSLSQVTCSHT